MQLAELKIHNFRSVRELTCLIGRTCTFIGPNNHGKSNILGAVEFLLSPGMKISRDDFFSGSPAVDNTLFVEGLFSDLTEQEKATFRKYLGAEQSIRVHKFAILSDADDVEIGYRGYLDQPRLWWLQDGAFERLRTQEMITAEAREIPELSALLEGGGRITKERIREFQLAYITRHKDELEFDHRLEDTPLLGVKNIAGGILPDFYLVPAVRDLGDETKTTGTATFSRLLQRAVAEMTARDPRFLDLQERLGSLVGELNERPTDPSTEPSSELDRLERTLKSELAPWGVDISILVTPPEVRKVFELGTELWINDGHSTVAERKGHGLQRAVIFALIRAWSTALRVATEDRGPRARAASESLVFAIEEPELFLHPQAQRTLSDSLRTIAATPEHQVLVCTHSTHFIDLENYYSIVVVHRTDCALGTKVKQCTRDLFAGEGDRERRNRFKMASWINPDRGELFFAKKVVLVEGETERVVLPFLANKLGCQDKRVSIIDCGSKNNIPLYLEILNAFEIPYAVVHDEDPLPEPLPTSWQPDKTAEKRRIFALNEQIRRLVRPDLGHREMLSPDFEGISGVSVSQRDKKGKPLAAIDHFAAVAPDAIPDKLAEVIRRLFSTS